MAKLALLLVLGAAAAFSPAPHIARVAAARVAARAQRAGGSGGVAPRRAEGDSDDYDVLASSPTRDDKKSPFAITSNTFAGTTGGTPKDPALREPNLVAERVPIAFALATAAIGLYVGATTYL